MSITNCIGQAMVGLSITAACSYPIRNRNINKIGWPDHYELNLLHNKCRYIEVSNHDNFGTVVPDSVVDLA